VALDRDGTDRAVGLAGIFGTRGRVHVPPEDFEPRDDLNDWPAGRREGGSRRFSIHSGAGACGAKDHAGVQDLLCEIGHKDRSAAMHTCAW
jgi:hypothetical protein